VVLKAYTIPFEPLMAGQPQIPGIFLEVTFLVYKDKEHVIRLARVLPGG
jgi:hypothetical protein